MEKLLVLRGEQKAESSVEESFVEHKVFSQSVVLARVASSF